LVTEMTMLPGTNKVRRRLNPKKTLKQLTRVFGKDWVTSYLKAKKVREETGKKEKAGTLYSGKKCFCRNSAVL